MLETYKKLYQEKLVETAEEAIEIIEPGEGLVYPLGAGEPPTLHKALSNYEGLDNNRLYTMLTMNPVINVGREKLTHYSFFLNSPDRKPFNNGETELIPCNFSKIPEILHEREPEPVIIALVSPIDENGYFSLGVGVSYVGPQIPHAKKIILEVSDKMPRTFGIMNEIHISQVDKIIETNVDLPELPEPELTEEDIKIGKYVADYVKDYDTIQIGIGGMPNAVMNELVNAKGLGLHSEMYTSKAQYLAEEGALTNEHKQNYVGKSIATFALGPRKMYDFMDNNPTIFMVPCDISNGLKYIGEHKHFVSINAAVQVDLLGQANSEKVGSTYYSSTGGQADFAKGVTLSDDGRGFICLKSTAKGGTVSTIVPTLDDGAVVTTNKNDIDKVVTEFGVAELRNKTISERVEALIAIAHPDFRDELTEKAKEMGYLA
ncbi:acetyl-CoA hydrolase/transferase family protein [Aerococcaceae bacterium DSM 111020]|nr:acetyl-CoA hydrolase/transferase family protein [Aerococcaceae bacterium DSM 111020]